MVITGCNTGIGLETAKALAKLNATIVMANRASEKSTEALKIVQKIAPNPSNIEILELDLTSFDSIRKFSEEMHKKNQKIDILVFYHNLI